MDLKKIAAIFEQSKAFGEGLPRLTFVRKLIVIPVVKKTVPGFERVRALSRWDANASQVGDKYVYRIIDSYVNIEGEKITGVPAAPGDINATPSSIEAKVNRLLNRQALPRKLVKGPAKNVPQTIPTKVLRELRSKNSKLAEVLSKIQAKVNEGKQEVEEPKIEINKNLRPKREQGRSYITSDEIPLLFSIRADLFRNTTDPRQKTIILLEIGRDIVRFVGEYIINAPCASKAVIAVANDLTLLLGIDYGSISSELNRMAPDMFKRGYLLVLDLVVDTYVNANRSRVDQLFVKRPVHLSNSDADGRAPIQPSLLARINEIYPTELPDNTTMKATALPPAIGKIDSRILDREMRNNPGFIHTYGHDQTMQPFVIYNDPSHLLNNATDETAEFYDNYHNAVAAAAVMRTHNDKRTANGGYISTTYGAELMFAVFKNTEQQAASDKSFTYENLSTITMRNEDYAQFHHEFLDYKYCDKEGSPFYGKFIPAQYPTLEFMESKEYIPNACVLSTFICILREDELKTTYEDLVKHAGIVPLRPNDKNRSRVLRAYVDNIRNSPNPEIPISLDEFNKICIGIDVTAHVFTCDGVHIGKYGAKHSNKRNKHHRTSFNFIYAGGHLYYCSEKSEIASKWGGKNTSEKPSLIPKMPDGNYNCTPQEERITDAANVTEFKDLAEFMQDPAKWKNTMIFKDDTDLIDAFTTIRKTTGLITTPVIRGNNVRKLTGRHIIGDKQVRFSIVSNISERGIRISDPQEYAQYDTLCVALHNIMITHGNRSDYTAETLPIFKEAIKPFIGRLNHVSGKYPHIDCSKHYTAEAMRIPEFPVFGLFDSPRLYAEGQDAAAVDLDDMTLYLVQCPTDAFARFGNAAPPLYYWYYGYLIGTLLHLSSSDKPILIHAELRPATTKKNKLAEFFDDKEFNAPLKRAANETWGKLGIYEQSGERTLIYVNADEAAAAINAAKLIPGIKTREYPMGDGIIALQIETEKVACTNGFLPIKKAIYDSSRLSMLRLFDMMLKSSLTPLAINTDAIYYSGDATNLIIGLDENNMIGKAPDQYNISVEHKEISAYPYGRLLDIIPPMPKLKSYAPRESFQEKQVCDENYVLDPTFHHNTNKILVHGEFPGVGKSYTSLELATRICNERTALLREHNPEAPRATAIFCAPFNEHLLDNFAEYNKIGTCKTSASFFSMYLDKDMTLAVRNESEDPAIPEDVCVIVFDEVYLNNVTVLTQIFCLMQNRPDLVYVFNGDYYGQMKAIANYHKSDIIKLAIDQITAGGKELILTEIKRNKNPRYKEFVIRLRETKTMFSNDRIKALIALCDEFGIKCVSDPREVKNFDRAIAWRNVTKMTLNQLKARQIVVGTKIRCHDAFKCKVFNGIETRDVREKLKKGTVHGDFRRGDAYEVIAVEYDEKDRTQGNIVMRPIDGTEYKCKEAAIALPFKYMSHFGVHFSKTAHGYQGATIRGKVLVCDIFTEHELKPEAYNYVALTRNTNLEDIYLYTGPANFNIDKPEFANHPVDKSKQICRSCLKVLSAQEHGPKAVKCVYCERIDNAQIEEQKENVVEQV